MDFQECKKQDFEISQRIVFESMRTQTTAIANMNPYLKKGVAKDSRKFMPFTWDKEDKKVRDRQAKPQTLEEQKRIVHAIARTFGQKKKGIKK